MDDIIAGVIGFSMVALFIGGLAVSIGSIPFGIIAATVILMAFVDLFQSIRKNRD